MIITGAGLLFLAYLQFRYDEAPVSSGEKGVSGPDADPDVEMFFDSLSKRYRNRYEQKLDGRFAITLEIRENWDDEDAEPVTDKFEKDPNSGPAALKINELFLKKKRLLIVGNPGAGKTVLLLKLALNLLENTERRGNYQIPVIFNLVSWSPKYRKFEDWLVAMLVYGEGLSRDLAEKMLHKNRIVFLFDGLDELARNEKKKIAAKKRADCLEALTLYFRKGRQNVICCRKKEFVRIRAATGQDAPVSAKIDIKDLTQDQIEGALLEASYSVREGRNVDEVSAVNILTLLQEDKGKALSEVLQTPFYFTTALEVFDQQNVKFPDLPKNIKSLQKYLLDKFVKNKLEHTPNPNEFEFGKTWTMLVSLATLMEKKQLITFELADLQPSDLTKRWTYTAFFGLAVTLLFSLVFILYVGLVHGLSDEVSYPEFFGGLIFSSFFGFFLGMSIGSEDEITTEDIVRLSFSRFLSWERVAIKSLLFGLGVGGITSLFLIATTGVVFGVIFGLLSSIAWGFGNLKRITRFAYLKSPYQRIYGGFTVNLAFVILVSILIMWLTYFFETANSKWLIAVSILTLYLSFIPLLRHPLIRHFILRFALRFEGVVIPKYVTFLNYIDATRILERDGGHWRFRHQNLQEYFAELSKGPTMRKPAL